MGNCFKTNNRLSHIDDSVKVMIRHDTKALEKKGQKPGGYVPRAPHPMLDRHDVEEVGGGGGGGGNDAPVQATEDWGSLDCRFLDLFVGIIRRKLMIFHYYLFKGERV